MKDIRNKRVYKYTSAKYGISSLKDRRLKVATTADLNDPLDLCPLDTTDPVIAEAAQSITSYFKDNAGILCFSRNWDNLLLWRHYGDSHEGVCLGFDISEGDSGNNYDTDVLYQPNLLKICRPVDVNIDLANRLLRTKHESWSYEQEVRMFVGLNDPPDANGINWSEFGQRLVIKEIIAGAQCSRAHSKDIDAAVKLYSDTVDCWQAEMRTDAFLLAKLDYPPNWLRQCKASHFTSALPVREVSFGQVMRSFLPFVGQFMWAGKLTLTPAHGR